MDWLEGAGAVDEPALSRERESLAGMLHDEVLQGLIAARWAVDDIAPDALTAEAAEALAEVTRALEHTEERVREQIARLRVPGGVDRPGVDGRKGDGGAT